MVRNETDELPLWQVLILMPLVVPLVAAMVMIALAYSAYEQSWVGKWVRRA